MTFREGLLFARSHIAFIGGLVGAFLLIAQIEGWTWADFEALRQGRVETAQVVEGPELPMPVALMKMRPTDGIDSELREWATHAWKYFENNLQAETGLVNSANDYHSTTLWDTASYLLGMISAERLGVIDKDVFDDRMTQALDSLARLPLVEGVAPNKAYHTKTLEMVDYGNQPSPTGIGWSAIDIARILVPLQAIVWTHPEHTPAVRKIVARWNFDEITRDGTLYGASRDSLGRLERLQEGRLGYEEYAAKSFTLFGLDVGEAILYDDHLEVVEIEGIPIATDDRDFETLGANNYVVSEPYVLDGIEFGFDHNSKNLAINVYTVQKERAGRVGKTTAVSETQIDRAPYFVYNTVYANGQAWNTITESNEEASAFRTLSTKAALGWYALFDDPYGDSLLDEIRTLFDEELGFYSGRYESSGELNEVATANTNGIILECLAYLHSGPVLKAPRLAVRNLGDSVEEGATEESRRSDSGDGEVPQPEDLKPQELASVSRLEGARETGAVLSLERKTK